MSRIVFNFHTKENIKNYYCGIALAFVKITFLAMTFDKIVRQFRRNGTRCRSGNIMNTLLDAIKQAKQIHDKRLNGGKDEARGTGPSKIIHGWFAKELYSRLMEKNSSLKVLAKGFPFEQGEGKLLDPEGWELAFPAAYLGKKRSDIAIAYQKRRITPTGRVSREFCYEPVSAMLSKCVHQNYSQNGPNYFQSQIAETTCIRRAGFPVGTIFCVDHKPSYYNKKGEFKKTETFGRDQVIMYLDLFNKDPSVVIERPNAMLLYVFDFDSDGNAIKTKPEDLGFDPRIDAELISQYEKLSDINNFLQNTIDCLPDQLTN
jgi:hypothetical protein